MFVLSMGSSNVCKARKETDILPANVAMNEKIKQLRGHWECSMTTCHSEVCFIPAKGPHFALSHDLTEKWAAAIVHSFMTCYNHLLLLGLNSFVVPNLPLSTPLQILLHSTPSQPILLFQNLQYCRLVSTI